MNLNKVQQYIRENHLFTTSQKILVAISGGADSVSLLRILLSLGYTCEAAHCNFRLRGEESDRDEYFVKQLCKQLHIPLHVTCFNTANPMGAMVRPINPSCHNTAESSSVAGISAPSDWLFSSTQMLLLPRERR